MKKPKFVDHIHCLICSSCKDLDKDDPPYRTYICNRCMHTFPDDYILYRLKCEKEGIYHKSFDLLERRLAFGDQGIEQRPELIDDFNFDEFDYVLQVFKK